MPAWPARFVLSNGRYQCWINESGSGLSQYDQWALTAWSPDRLTDLSQRLFSTRPTVAAIGPIGSLAPYERVAGALPKAESSTRRLAV